MSEGSNSQLQGSLDHKQSTVNNEDEDDTSEFADSQQDSLESGASKDQCGSNNSSDCIEIKVEVEVQERVNSYSQQGREQINQTGKKGKRQSKNQLILFLTGVQEFLYFVFAKQKSFRSYSIFCPRDQYAQSFVLKAQMPKEKIKKLQKKNSWVEEATQQQIKSHTQEIELQDTITLFKKKYFSNGASRVFKSELLMENKYQLDQIQRRMNQFGIKFCILQDSTAALDKGPRERQQCHINQNQNQDFNNQTIVERQVYESISVKKIHFNDTAFRNNQQQKNPQEFEKEYAKIKTFFLRFPDPSNNGDKQSNEQSMIAYIKEEKQLYQFFDQFPEKYNQYLFIYQKPPQQDTVGHSQFVWQELSLEKSIQHFNKLIRKGDIFAIKHLWNDSFSANVKHIINNWQTCIGQFEQEINDLTLLVDYKINKFTYDSDSIYEYIYPGISSLHKTLVNFFKKMGINMTTKYIKKILKKSNFTDKDIDCFIRKHFKIQEDTLVQKIIDYYIQEKDVLIRKKQGIIVNVNRRQKMTLERFISQRQINHELPVYFGDVLSIIDHIKGAINKYQIEQVDFVKQEAPSARAYMQEIEAQKVTENQCLGCSTFFIKDMSIMDETINKTPLKVFSSSQDMRNIENQIKDEICSMLNGKGGIILFDCPYNYDKVRAVGRVWTQKEKDQLEQRMSSYLQVFEPRAAVRNSLKISFVPVIQNPYEHHYTQDYTTYASEESLIKPFQYFKVRQYLNGTFILRIKVCASDPTTVFYWNQNTNANLEEQYRNYSISTRINQNKKVIKMKNIGKLIKMKMKECYLPASLNPEERRLINRPKTYFDHQCRLPESGRVITQGLSKGSRSQIYAKNFCFASMLVVKSTNIQDVKKAFKESGIDAQIKQLFQNNDLPTAKHTAIMYHNIKFQDLLKTIKDNNKFKFGNKQMLAISITNYLKLQKRNENNPFMRWQFKNLVEWFRKQFPKETIRLFQFKTGNRLEQSEYFLECQSHEATLYLYYVTNFLKDKTTFKNPLHLDKMSQNQLKVSFIKIDEDIYQSANQNYFSRPETQEQIEKNQNGLMLSQSAIQHTPGAHSNQDQPTQLSKLKNAMSHERYESAVVDSICH